MGLPDPRRATAPGDRGGKQTRRGDGIDTHGTPEMRDVLRKVGSVNLALAVEREALIIVAPDYVITPEGVELGPFMTEWTATLGTATVNGSRFTVYFISDDVADWALEALMGGRL